MNPTLYIKNVSGKGRAVFSKQSIPKDAVIEICPLIVLPGADYELVTATQMINYCFFFNPEKAELAIALGFGSLYNHASLPNALHQLDMKIKCLFFYAAREIPAGEEICINYDGESTADTPKWFNDRNLKYLP
jgi:SET domain-containing protein